MARHEADREDLLREATALVDRVELDLPEFSERIVMGFRRDGAGSIYFGADPALHFNASGELRRAFCAGRLVKAEGGRLVALTRHRTEHQVQLIRDPWDTERTARFLDAMRRDVARVRDALRGGKFQVVGQVTDDPHLLSRMDQWLARLEVGLRVADRPHAK